MERSSISLSTTLDHSDEEDGGETNHQTKPETNHQTNHQTLVGTRGKAEATGTKKTTNKKETTEKSPEGSRKMNMFGSLRGRIQDKLHKKTAAPRLDARAPSRDATSDKAKLKAKLKVVTNDKLVGDAGEKTNNIGKSINMSHVMEGQGEKSTAPLTRASFARGDYLVHPAHGVGYVRGVEAEEVAGVRLDMIAISFEQERMVVRVPACEYENCGLRCVSSPETMEGIYDTLKTKRRIRKTMWGRRAQEYDNKIRSGDPVRLAQVVRELYRGEEQPSPSYSERQYYQLALERLSREVAVVEKIEAHLAVEKLETILAAA